MKTKLLLVYPNQFGYHTDTYKYCENLRDSFNISYICFDQGLEKLALPSIDVVYLPYNVGKIKRLLLFYKTIIRFTKRNNIDILFVVQFKFSFILGLFAKARVKILDYRTGDLSSNTLMRKLRNLFLSLDSVFFKNICSISEGLRDILYLSRDHTLILPLGADVISGKALTFDRIDLLYVGSLSSRNIHHTLEGFSMFLTKNKELTNLISYTIIGFGNKIDEEFIRNSIERLGINMKVKFIGRKKHNELQPYFEACNIGVAFVPITPYYDFQPTTKLFEYILSGMPVIATNTFENRRIVNYTNGILINDTPAAFQNGLEVLYNNLHTFDSNNIRTSFEDHNWEAIVKKTLLPYIQSLLK